MNGTDNKIVAFPSTVAEGSQQEAPAKNSLDPATTHDECTSATTTTTTSAAETTPVAIIAHRSFLSDEWIPSGSGVGVEPASTVSPSGGPVVGFDFFGNIVPEGGTSRANKRVNHMILGLVLLGLFVAAIAIWLLARNPRHLLHHEGDN
eukprot:1192345-Prorocentrum_minimum.AAC.2